MNKRFAVSLVAAASLLASGSAFAQSTTAAGAANGARTGGEIAGPVGEIVGGTVGAAVGAGLEIPNAVITAIPRDEPSVVVRERVVVGEPLPDTVVLRPVPRYSEYRYAVVNDRRVIVEPAHPPDREDHRLIGRVLTCRDPRGQIAREDFRMAQARFFHEAASWPGGSIA
ncbi:hypothetical protein ACVW17_006568 [Bradyrhizobium sp. USDA 4473]